MKAIITLGIVALCLTGCSTAPKTQPDEKLLPALRPYVQEIANDVNSVPAERKVVLDQIAATIATRLEDGHDADLTFICTHNSRRSHMSQIWAQTAAVYYGLDR